MMPASTRNSARRRVAGRRRRCQAITDAGCKGGEAQRPWRGAFVLVLVPGSTVYADEGIHIWLKLRNHRLHGVGVPTVPLRVPRRGGITRPQAEVGDNSDLAADHSRTSWR